MSRRLITLVAASVAILMLAAVPASAVERHVVREEVTVPDVKNPTTEAELHIGALWHLTLNRSEVASVYYNFEGAYQGAIATAGSVCAKMVHWLAKTACVAAVAVYGSGIWNSIKTAVKYRQCLDFAFVSPLLGPPVLVYWQRLSGSHSWCN